MMYLQLYKLHTEDSGMYKKMMRLHTHYYYYYVSLSCSSKPTQYVEPQKELKYGVRERKEQKKKSISDLELEIFISKTFLLIFKHFYT